MGGAQSMVADLATGLTQRGHSVRLYCTDGSQVPGVELVTVPRPVDGGTALVMPGGPPPPPAPGVAAALASMFERVMAAHVDVVSQHAFDAPAFELAAELPVLHTLHLPPLVPSVVEAAARVPARRLATVSASCLRSWEGAGARCPRWYRREWEESWSTPMTWKRWRALFARASNSIGGSCGVAHSGALAWKPPWTDMRWPWMRHRDEAERGRHGWVRWYRERDRRRAPTPRVRGHLAEPAGRLRRIRRATGQARFQPSGGA